MTEHRENRPEIFPYPGIRVESGYHTPTLNPGETVWNPQLANRLRQYQPRILTIDSLPAFANQVNLDTLEASLPAFPCDISPEKNLHLVSGDILYPSENNTLLTRDYPWLLNCLFETKKSENLENDYYLKTLAKVLLGFGILGIPPIFLTKQYFNTPLDRRNFLKKVPTCASLIPITAWLAANINVPLSTIAPNEKVSKLSQSVAKISSFVYQDWYVGGRTAIMIAKTHDAIDFLKLPFDSAAAIVMGYFHWPEAQRLLKNKKMLLNCILAFGQKMTEMVQGVLTDQDTAGLLNNVAETLSVTKIITIVNHPQKVIKEGDVLNRGFFQSQTVLEAFRR